MKTRISIVKDLPEVELVGRSIGPVKEGTVIDAEHWEAEVLENHGFSEPENVLDLAGVRKQILAEERMSTIAPLPQNFYDKIKRRLDSLKNSGLDEEFEELRDAMSTLAEMRVQKLAHLAASGVDARELLPEEKFLFNRLSEALDDWKEWLDRLFGGETKKEVGEHGGKNGESVRHAARDSADIQEEGISPTDVHA